jgi:HAD superfamily hydrolase (TIGR01662 family)
VTQTDPKITAVLFDLGGTLVTMSSTYSEDHWRRAAKRAAYHLQTRGYNITPEQFSKEFLGIRAAYSQFTQVTRVDVDTRVQLAAALNNLGIPARPQSRIIRHILEKIYEEEVEESELYPNALETIRYLKQNYKLGLVTNNSSSDQVWLTLDKFEMRPLFETIQISANLGLRKPHTGIFTQALRKLGAHPTESVYIGDSEIPDVLGPQRIGMKTILIKRHSEPVLRSNPDAIIEDLTQIPTILDEWNR